MTEYEGFDHPEHLWTGEDQDRVGLGFDCVSGGYCYLTYRSPDFVEQLLLDRAQIEWLMTKGFPAVLKDLDQTDDESYEQANNAEFCKHAVPARHCSVCAR